MRILHSLFVAALSVLLGLCLGAQALAQSFPVKPLKLVVPFPRMTLLAVTEARPVPPFATGKTPEIADAEIAIVTLDAEVSRPFASTLNCPT